MVGKRPSELETGNRGLYFLASIKDGVSSNRQARIPENSLLILLVEKNKEERIRKLFKK